VGLNKYVLVLLTLGCSADAPRASDSAQANPAVPNATVKANDSLPQGNAARAARSTILFVGTSLSAGYGLEPDSAYPLQIQRMIDSAGLRFEVVNASVSGETSSALLRRLDWLLREPFEILIIETGANDGLRGIPVATMADNVQRIIDRVRSIRPSARLALVQMEAPPNLGAAYTRGFREVFPAMAKKNGVVLLPFLLEDVAGIRELNQGDGIHPNYEGERILARNVWKGLRPMLQ
jgi:acyl-CoA thioesterase I